MQLAISLPDFDTLVVAIDIFSYYSKYIMMYSILHFIYKTKVRF